MECVAFGAFRMLYDAGSLWGLWLIFIGWFLLQAGGAEQMQAELLSALQGLTAGDIAKLMPDTPMRRAVETGSRAPSSPRPTLQAAWLAPSSPRPRFSRPLRQ